MMRPLLLCVVLLPLSALAGDPHTFDVAAKVRSTKLVTKGVVPDRLALLTDDTAKPLQVESACEVRLAVESSFFKGDQTVFASPAACQVLKSGSRVRVEYFGLAGHFQFVSLELDGHWYSLPRMRVTHSQNPSVRACLEAVDGGEAKQHCTPRAAPAL